MVPVAICFLAMGSPVTAPSCWKLSLLLASLMTEKGRVCVKAGKGMCLGSFVAWVMKELSWRQGMKVGRVIRKRIHKRSGLESGQSSAPLMTFREQ